MKTNNEELTMSGLKHYISKRDKSGVITGFEVVKDSIHNIESLNKKISEWNNDPKHDDDYELIKDETFIKVLNYIHRFDGMKDDENTIERIKKLENAMSDIESIVSTI